jgi:error-prone DNA polymerase
VTDLVPLAVKSHYSIGLGTAAPHALVQQAGRLGYGSLGLADVENVYGQVQFHAACRARGIRPITGVELRASLPSPPGMNTHDTSRARVVLLARNARGYAQLCRIVTARRTSAEAGSFPPIPCDGLTDVFLLTDDVPMLCELARVIGPQALRALLLRPGPAAREVALRAAARRLDVALVAGLHATRLGPADRPLAALLERVHGKGRAEPACSPTSELLAPTQLATLFADVPEATREASAIAEACCVDLLNHAKAPPDPPAAGRQLFAACAARLEGLSAATGAGAAGYAERLSSEIATITRLGLCEPFTALAALVADACARGVPVAARGSAVSSLVGHLLGFTPIDPVAHGLFFERFASAARRRPPDIDLDVASRHRDALIERFVAARGPARTARVGSLQTFRQRSAYRRGLAAVGAPSELIERFMRQLPPDELLDAGHPVPRRVLPEAWHAPLETIARLVGTPRHIAMHPGGIVLGREPLTDWLPLERTRGGALVSQYDAESLAELGFMKVDLLGNHCLDEVAATLSARALVAPDGEVRLARDIPLADDATLARIGRAETLGCFQLESPLQRSVLARLPIHALDDVALALAIVRPGPGSGQARELFIERARAAALERQGRPEGPRADSEPASPHRPEPIAWRLAGTHDLLIYEEDILIVLASVTGIPIETAEAMRVSLQARADDAGWLERARRRFIASGRARGIAEGEADRLWALIARFASYSFNKAHATSQALLAYQSAYLASHAPLEHGCAQLDHHGGAYPRRVLAAELARRGIQILLPCIRRSGLECVVEVDAADPMRRGIRIGLGLVHSLRGTTRQRLLALGPFASTEDFSRQVQPRAAELAALLRTGACDELLGLTRTDYPWVHEVVLERLLAGGSARLDDSIERVRDRLAEAPPESLERERSLRRIQNELRYLRMHVSDHPMRVLRPDAERLGCVPSDRLSRYTGERVPFAGIVAATRRVPVWDGGATQYITLEDERGLVEARISPHRLTQLGPALTTPGPYLLQARVIERHGVLYLSIESLIPFYQRSARGSG